MKRLFTILITFGILFIAGCSRDTILDREDDGSVAIDVKMQSSTSNTTKSTNNTITGDTVFIDDDVFVTAQQDLLMPESYITKGTALNSSAAISTVTLLLRGGTSTSFSTSDALVKTLNYKYSNGAYTPVSSSDKYLLPVNVSNKWTFSAYSPTVNASNGLSLVDPLGNFLSYTVPAIVANHPDICVADITNNQDIINSTGKENLRTLNLYHALTAVGIAVRGDGVKIKSATITGFLSTGKVALTYPLSSNARVPWSSQTNRTTSEMALGLEDKFYTAQWSNSWINCTKDDGYLMMMPQTLTDDVKLKVVYTYEKGPEAGQDLTFTTQLNKITNGWKAGSKLMYNIRLKTAPVVPKDTKLEIKNYRAGYTTSIPVPFSNVGPDENLTFTWDASWLRIHRGSPTSGTQPGGAASGWSTGAGSVTNNIFFYATNDNSSTMKRTATVTVKGTKSKETTFTVTQYMYSYLTITPNVISIADYNPRPWEAGTLKIKYSSNFPYTSIHHISGHPWITARATSEGVLTITYQINPMANIDRETIFSMGIMVDGNAIDEAYVKIKQQASEFWINTTDNYNANFSIYGDDSSTKPHAEANSTCTSYKRGTRVPTRNEFIEITNAVKSGMWVNNANLIIGGSDYWTSERNGTIGGFLPAYYTYIPSGSGPTLKYSFGRLHVYNSQRVRCIQYDYSQIY